MKSLESPDVLAFSTYSWNLKQSIEVASLGKKSFPECLVVFGGPMSPTNPNDLRMLFEKYPFIDIVVNGMGEWAFSEILLAKLGEKELKSISGISYLNKDGKVITNKPEFIKNVNKF